MFKRVVGLEINSDKIRGVELSGGSKKHILHAMGSVDVPEGAIDDGVVVQIDVVANVLKDLWKKYSFKTKDVMFGVDNKYVLVREVLVPHDENTKFEHAFKANIQKLLPVDQNTVELDHIPLCQKSQKGEGTKTLIVAARKKMIADYVEVFKKSKLNLVDIDVNTLVLSRVLPPALKTENDNMVINFKKDMMNVVIYSGGLPLLARNVTIDDFSYKDQEDFYNQYFQRIGKDIASSMSFYHSSFNEHIGKIMVTGFGTWNEQMVHFIKDVSKTDVQVINPFTSPDLKIKNVDITKPYEFSIAYALAIRGMESERL